MPPTLLRDRRLWLLLGAAAALRAVALIGLAIGDPTLRELHSDPALYDAWARALVAGEDFTQGRPFWLPPLYPWLLAALYTVTGGGLWGTFLAQGALGLVTTALVVATCEAALTLDDARDAASNRLVALLGGGLWTAYLPTWFFESRLLGVNVALPLCTASLLLVLVGLRHLRHGGRAALYGLAAGVLLGLACLARPNLLFAAPLAALGAMPSVRGPARLGLVVAMLFGAVGVGVGSLAGPLANRAVSGQTVWVSSNGGVNFWFGHNDAARGTFVAPSPQWGSIKAQRDVSTVEASTTLGRAVDEREASRFWFRRGLRWIQEHPQAELGLVLRKLTASFSNVEYGIQYVPAATRAQVPLLWLAPLPFALLAALAALGVGELRGARGALGGWIAAGLLAAVLYFTYSRFRLTWLPALMPFAGLGLARVAGVVRNERRPGLTSWAAAALLAALAFVPAEGAYPRQLFAHAEVDMGRAFLARGDGGAARRVLERALERVPNEASGLVELARLERAEGREREALDLLERAVRVPVEFPAAPRELAVLLATTNDPELRDGPRAFALLEEWLVRHPAPDPARPAMLVLLASLRIDAGGPDARARARREVEEALALDPDVAGAREVLAYLEQ